MGRAHLKEFIRFKKDAKHLQKDIPDKSIVMKTEPLAEEKSGKTEELCNVRLLLYSKMSVPYL